MTDLNWSEYTIVEQDPEKMGGLPTVRDWRVTADSVAGNHEDGLSAGEIAYMFSLPLEDVQGVLAYAQEARRSLHARSV